MRNNLVKNIVSIQQEIKRLQSELEAAKEKLLLDMENGKNPKTFILDNYQYTYVEPSTRISLDTDRIKTELPEVYSLYKKITVTKPSLRITAK